MEKHRLFQWSGDGVAGQILQYIFKMGFKAFRVEQHIHHMSPRLLQRRLSKTIRSRKGDFRPIRRCPGEIFGPSKGINTKESGGKREKRIPGRLAVQRRRGPPTSVEGKRLPAVWPGSKPEETYKQGGRPPGCRRGRSRLGRSKLKEIRPRYTQERGKKTPGLFFSFSFFLG